jgi:small subunit ribosomal protein S16
MAVKIRLARAGKKKVVFHKIVAVDSRKKRDGAVLDDIGTYDARTGELVRFNKELYDKWIGHGAQVSDSAKKIYKQFVKAQKAQA